MEYICYHCSQNKKDFYPKLILDIKQKKNIYNICSVCNTKEKTILKIEDNKSYKNYKLNNGVIQ